MSRILLPPAPRFPVARIEPVRLWGRGSRLAPLALALRALDGDRVTDEEVIDAIRACPPHFLKKTNSWGNGLMLLLFNNTNFAKVGDATGLRGSTTAGSLYLSLHTADPNVTGDQTTSETTYTSYARKAIARASGAGGWTVSGDSADLTDALTSFVAGTGGAGTVTHFGIGTDSSGAGVLLYSGTVTPNIVVGNGITPQVTSASGVTES